MDENNNNYLIDIITNSLIISAILIIYGLLIYIIDISLFVKWWYGISVIVISIALLIYFGINYRKSVGGILSYKDSFIYLYLLSIIGGAIQLIWGIIFFQVIDPELGNTLTELVIQNTVDMLERFGGGEAVDATISSLEEELPKSFSPLGQVKTFGWQFLTSAVGCAFVAIFVKKNEEVSDRLN